jgi:predicted N-acetyltransferase YhbS
MSQPCVDRARPDELEALLAVFDGAFMHDHPGHRHFVELAPHLYLPENFRAEDHLVVREGGRPVAALALLPLQFAAGPNMIAGAGVGQVSTLPEFRGGGFMTAMMKHVEALMDRDGPDGVVLAYLGGDRFRYARFGFEKAGCAWQFEVSGPSLGALDLTPWTFTEQERLAPWMHECFEQKPYRRAVAFNEAVWAVRRPGGRLLTAEGPAGRATVTYAKHEDPALDDRVDVMRPGHVTIRDWGGPADGVMALLGELARNCGGGHVSVRTPAVGDDLTRKLLSHSATFHPQTQANLRIGRLRALLEAYMPWFSRAPGICPEGLTLRMSDADQQAALFLGNTAAVEENGGRHLIELSRLEMTSFLFGPFTPSRRFDLSPRLAGLDAVLPLPFYVSGIANV